MKKNNPRGHSGMGKRQARYARPFLLIAKQMASLFFSKILCQNKGAPKKWQVNAKKMASEGQKKGVKQMNLSMNNKSITLLFKVLK